MYNKNTNMMNTKANVFYEREFEIGAVHVLCNCEKET